MCVSQATSSVSSCVCFVAGALRGIHAEALLPPYPKGWISAAAAPVTWTDLLGARAERVPDYSSYLSRIPGRATDSGSSIHPRNFRGSRLRQAHLRPPHGASPRLIKRQRCWRVDRRWQILRLAPSNAGAASESTTAGSLEAFSQGTAGSRED